MIACGKKRALLSPSVLPIKAERCKPSGACFLHGPVFFTDHDGEDAASRGDVCRHVSRAEPRRLQPRQCWFTFVEVP